MSDFLPDWRNDWLYTLVLREADSAWQWCNQVPERDFWRYVLVEEWSSASGAHCGGEVVRAWIRDGEGLREITMAEYEQQKRRIRGRMYPFILVQFHIEPERTRVILGRREASTAGTGHRYLVRGEGDKASLEGDPTGGAWTS